MRSQISWKPIDLPCPVCASTWIKKLGKRGGRAHRLGLGVETTVVRCGDCRVVYTAPTLLPESNPYDTSSADEYFQLHDFNQKVERGERLAQFAEDILGKGRVLELGCGRGELLKGFINRGWEAYGVEMTEGYAEVARSQGVEVECKSIEECKSLKADEAYDVVLLAAILEHLYDPVETLSRVRRALKRGGLVYIDVPNESSLTMRLGNLYMRLRGRDWCINLSPSFSPFHVVGFSPKSLKNTLEIAGLRVHSMEVPKWNNALPQGKTFVQRTERRAMTVVQTVGERLGMGDGINCWAYRE